MSVHSRFNMLGNIYILWAGVIMASTEKSVIASSSEYHKYIHVFSCWLIRKVTCMFQHASCWLIHKPQTENTFPISLSVSLLLACCNWHAIETNIAYSNSKESSCCSLLSIAQWTDMSEWYCLAFLMGTWHCHQYCPISVHSKLLGQESRSSGTCGVCTLEVLHKDKIWRMSY